MKLLKLWREKCNTSILNIFYQICSQSPHSWFVYCTIKLLVKIIVLFHRQHWVVVNLMIRLYAAICRVRFVFWPMRITADIAIPLDFVYGEIWITTTLHVLIRLRIVIWLFSTSSYCTVTYQWACAAWRWVFKYT